jgi:preprotein translocase subunit SecF
MIDWLSYRKIYFTISGTLIIIGIFSLLNWKLRLGVDFTGGSVLEYRFERSISTEQAVKSLEAEGVGITSVSSIGKDSYMFRFPPIGEEDKTKIANILEENFGAIQELRFEKLGPSIGPELIKKTIYAIVIAASAILLWVAYQFKSIKFGTSAVLAMFHDTFILIGSFSLLGHFLQAETDYLFVTALLTTLSFSVHDTIVVYDRIRESQKKFGGNLKDLANKAITETMVRSLNNSFTIVFMLVALLLLGGTTIKWFATALFIGTVLGTYSSPFVAVPLLVTWDEVAEKIRARKR